VNIDVWSKDVRKRQLYDFLGWECVGKNAGSWSDRLLGFVLVLTTNK